MDQRSAGELSVVTVNLTQWDIVRVRINPEDRDEHPAVIISPVHVVKNAQVRKLNVLYCSKLPPGLGAAPTQFLLDNADGLDFRSVVDCSFYHVILRERIVGVGPRQWRAHHCPQAQAPGGVWTLAPHRVDPSPNERKKL